MNLKTRINKLEVILDETDCPVCSLHLPSVTEARAITESDLHKLVKLGVSRKEAIVQLRRATPMFMRRAGLFPVIPEGHCSGCGDRKLSLQEAAQEALEDMTASLNGDEIAAREILKKHVPDLAAWLN